MKLVKLGAADLSDLAAMLTASHLPTTDLTLPNRQFFRFEDDGQVLGFCGLEGTNSHRLLRSIVVASERRGGGTGSAILDAIEAEAARQGAERLHLLTTTAADFFRARGYLPGERHAAPPSIAASAEFTDLCPASASYLVKTLTP